MKGYILQSARLKIRKMDFSDVDDIFEMDSDPEVHRYIENCPVTSRDEITEVVKILNIQYKETGVGRWALERKDSGEVIGWCGLKLIKSMNKHENFYELGYRLKRKHWKKGYTTEACRAIIDYGRNILNLERIYAIIDPENQASRNVLQKLGFVYIENFKLDNRDIEWFELNLSV